jgi:divalent metal cation (Fe/Co/Zn/Cd) transporter
VLFRSVGVVALGGWQWLDPVIAIAVALNILRVGARLLARSGTGLLGRSVSRERHAAIEAVLERYVASVGIGWHALRTWEAVARTFVTLHLLVPGSWTVRRGHDLCERIEDDLRSLAPKTIVVVHLEPLDDGRSFTDLDLDRD